MDVNVTMSNSARNMGRPEAGIKTTQPINVIMKECLDEIDLATLRVSYMYFLINLTDFALQMGSPVVKDDRLCTGHVERQVYYR